jgi:mono/diheme cytochrome c family protein
LAKTDWVTGDKKRLIELVLNGMEGPIMVNDQPFNGSMPAHSFLNNEEMASILTYIRKSFGNNASSIHAREVANVRKTQVP